MLHITIEAVDPRNIEMCTLRQRLRSILLSLINGAICSSTSPLFHLFCSTRWFFVSMVTNQMRAFECYFPVVLNDTQGGYKSDIEP